ncbi:hypothetical protein MNBD_DELTA02-1171 [hydrothermal vent metagenome]|uniref:Uncharacterized protein n=1 Tax=hydrothermal vent metagenome TaxID=652676 RepID=A0A3B0VWJ6_9ZZZZ
MLAELMVVLALSIAMAAGSYARTRVWSTSVTLWSDASAKGPSRYRAANNAGAALIAEQRFDEAITYLVWAVAANPRSVEPYYNLGVAYLQQRDISSALPHFKEVLKINESLKGGHFGYRTRRNMVVGSAANLGNIYSLRGDMDKAIHYYKEALALDPGALSVHFNLAQAYQRTGRTGLAIKELEELLRLDPSDRGARRAIFQLKNQ